MIEMSINLLERESTHFDQVVLPRLSARTLLTGELAILKSGFFNSNISIWILVTGIANLFFICECRKKIDEPNSENRIEIDRLEAEKYEFIHELCLFTLLF